LPLQLAEEAVDAEAAQAVVVRGGQAREHLAAETTRAQDEPLPSLRGDLIADDGDEEVRDRDLRVGRRS
jgi:hypothetical protein